MSRNAIEFEIVASIATVKTSEFGKRAVLLAVAMITMPRKNGKKYLGWMNSPTLENCCWLAWRIAIHMTTNNPQNVVLRALSDLYSAKTVVNKKACNANSHTE